MADNPKVTFLKQEYENSETGAKVPGITIIVDGVFRQVCDKLIRDTGREQDYVALIQEALFNGINQVIGESQKKQ